MTSLCAKRDASGASVESDQIVAKPSSPSMRRTLTHPLFWLTLQIALTVIFVGAAGGLEARRVPDTRSYEIASDLDTLGERLGYYRSIGYPLFLDAVKAVGLTQQAIPSIQLAAYILALYLFWWALWRFSGSKWLAYAATFPLPWAAVMELVNRIQPDFLSAAATIAAVSITFLLVTKPRSLWLWTGFLLSAMAAYHLRPAAVFLIGFLPLLGGVVFWIRNSGSRPRAIRFALLLMLATVMPYWGFCTLRLVSVGHFGLVSFGGTNLAGLAANFISGGLITELPQEHRPLARGMLKLRRRIGLEPMMKGDRAEEFFAQYSDNIWKVANPAGKFELRKRKLDLERTGAQDRWRQNAAWQRQPEMVARNTIVGAMSKSVIRNRLHLYFSWVRAAQRYGLRQLTDYLWIVGPFLLSLISLPLMLLRCRKAPTSSVRIRDDPDPADHPTTQQTLIALLILGVGFFSGYLFLVSLISFPFTRYFQSMILFAPTMLCAQLFAIWRQIVSPNPV